MLNSPDLRAYDNQMCEYSDRSLRLILCYSVFISVFYFIHFIIPFGKFGPHYLGKATIAARAALPSPTSARGVFSRFRNPPNSDVDYMIFNVVDR